MKIPTLFGAAMLLGLIQFGSSQTSQAVLERRKMDEIIAPYKTEIMQEAFSSSDRGGISKNKDDVWFFLYNYKYDSNKFQKLEFYDDQSIKNANWIVGAEIKILIHGFTQSQNSSMCGVIKNAYLERAVKTGNQVNVICVDWGQLAFGLTDTKVPMYFSAVQNVEVAGERVGELIVKLVQLGITSPDLIHIIGFSLGAHVAGQAGQTFQKRMPTLPKCKRITGLDPAGPLFYVRCPLTGKQLSTADAQYVDVIHTSWGTYGIAKSCGHSDFFPNRGMNLIQTQPYCVNPLNNQMPLQVCSHNMAPVYYAMTICLPEMSACSCGSYWLWKAKCEADCRRTGSYTKWGENLDITSASGDYYCGIPDGTWLSSPSPRYVNDQTIKAVETNHFQRRQKINPTIFDDEHEFRHRKNVKFSQEKESPKYDHQNNIRRHRFNRDTGIFW